MNCSVCHLDFQNGERVTANIRQMFVFKPADVPDTVNPARATPDELFESRKEHVKTEIGKIFSTWGTEPIPTDAFGFRHLWCDPQIVANASSMRHSVLKHSIRYARQAKRMGAH